MSMSSVVRLTALSFCAGAVGVGGVSAQCDPAWRPGPGVVGLNNDVYALVSWDPDGPGPGEAQLIAGGAFTTAGGAGAIRIASWNGTSWSPLSTGMTGSNSAQVRALAVLPDHALVASGYDITNAGGVTAWNIARWDGNTWSKLGTAGVPGLNSGAYALHVDATGGLIAGGTFNNAGGTPTFAVARWNGTTWTAYPAGVGNVRSLVTLANGDLIAGGIFSGALGPQVSRFDGTKWNKMGAGLGGTFGGEYVYAVARLPSGEPLAAGTYSTSGGAQMRLASRFDGTAWVEMYSGLANAGLTCVLVRNGGAMVAGSGWTTAYPGASSTVLEWNGTAWESIGFFDGGGGPFVAALTEHNGELYAGGRFQQVISDVTFASNFVAKYGAPTPWFTQQPANASLCPGSASTFTASATGGVGLGYSWEVEVTPGVWSPLSTTPIALACGSISATGQGTGQISVTVAGCSGPFNHRIRSLATSACGSTPSAPATLKRCVPDCDCSASLDFFDFLCFQNEFSAGTAYADCDQSGSLDFFDFLCFQNEFAAGCP